MSEDSAGQKLDNAISNVTNFKSNVKNYFSGFKLQSPIRSPIGTQLNNSQRKIIVSQDIVGLKPILSSVGRGNDWSDLNQLFELYIKNFNSMSIKYQGGKYIPWFPYFNKMSDIISDLIDDLSASVTREVKSNPYMDDQTTLPKRSYYLNRASQANYNIYLHAISEVHNRVLKFFTIVKHNKYHDLYMQHYKTSMGLLVRAFKESGLTLNVDKGYNIIKIPTDDEIDSQIGALRKRMREADPYNQRGIGSQLPPPIPNKRLR